MIDFISTRPGADEQTAACSRLLVSVIAQAIKDATKPLTITEKRKLRNLDLQASSAIKFLFDEHSVFLLYASLIGCSVDAIRFALLNEVDELDSTILRGFGNKERRVIKERFAMGI